MHVYQINKKSNFMICMDLKRLISELNIITIDIQNNNLILMIFFICFFSVQTLIEAGIIEYVDFIEMHNLPRGNKMLQI